MCGSSVGIGLTEAIAAENAESAERGVLMWLPMRVPAGYLCDLCVLCGHCFAAHSFAPWRLCVSCGLLSGPVAGSSTQTGSGSGLTEEREVREEASHCSSYYHQPRSSRAAAILGLTPGSSVGSRLKEGIAAENAKGAERDTRRARACFSVAATSRRARASSGGSRPDAPSASRARESMRKACPSHGRRQPKECPSPATLPEGPHPPCPLRACC